MSKTHNWRDLLYLGEYEGAHLFAAESDSARLNGRGGLGHLVRFYLHGKDWIAYCSCPSPHNCWHAREAPLAHRYWELRDGLSSRTAAEFDKLHNQWWPKREATMERAAAEGNYLGRSHADWELFFVALLDEYEARTAATAKIAWAFGRGVVDAVLYDESAD